MIDEGSSELGSAALPAFFTPICAQARTGFSTVVSAWSSGKPWGRNTSSLAGRDGFQPMPRRKFAAEAKASGRLVHRSMRPSPVRSTPHFMKVEGMNCMLPMAPAHEPRICSRVM